LNVCAPNSIFSIFLVIALAVVDQLKYPRLCPLAGTTAAAPVIATTTAAAAPVAKKKYPIPAASVSGRNKC
jgi:hypothetical protein